MKTVCRQRRVSSNLTLSATFGFGMEVLNLFLRFTKDLHAQNLDMVVEEAKICYNVLAKQKKE